jgi:DNA-directed RNA polymerase subunit RPC12/RpoP
MKTGKINCRYCGGVRVAENDFCTGCGSPAAIAQQTQPERLARCPKCTDGGVRRHEQSGRYICNQCGFDAHSLDGTKCQNFPSSRNGRRRD